MGKQIHTLSNLNTQSRKANCRTCGDVSVIKIDKTRYACINRYYKGRLNSANKNKRLAAEVYFLFQGKEKPVGCEICGNKVKLNRDHRHKDTRARGWLCTPCNLGLGCFRDSCQLLEKAIAYLS